MRFNPRLLVSQLLLLFAVLNANAFEPDTTVKFSIAEEVYSVPGGDVYLSDDGLRLIVIGSISGYAVVRDPVTGDSVRVLENRVAGSVGESILVRNQYLDFLCTNEPSVNGIEAVFSDTRGGEVIRKQLGNEIVVAYSVLLDRYVTLDADRSLPWPERNTYRLKSLSTDSVIVSFVGQSVYAFDPDRGLMYAHRRNKLLAYDAENGATVRSYDTPMPLDSGIIVISQNGDWVYMSTDIYGAGGPTPGNHVAAVNTEVGSVVHASISDDTNPWFDLDGGGFGKVQDHLYVAGVTTVLGACHFAVRGYNASHESSYSILDSTFDTPRGCNLPRSFAVSPNLERVYITQHDSARQELRLTAYAVHFITSSVPQVLVEDGHQSIAIEAGETTVIRKRSNAELESLSLTDLHGIRHDEFEYELSQSGFWRVVIPADLPRGMYVLHSRSRPDPYQIRLLVY